MFHHIAEFYWHKLNRKGLTTNQYAWYSGAYRLYLRLSHAGDRSE